MKPTTPLLLVILALFLIPGTLATDYILYNNTNSSFNAVNWGLSGGNKIELAARITINDPVNITGFSILRGATTNPGGDYTIAFETDNSEAPSNTYACPGAYYNFSASEISTGGNPTEYRKNFTTICEVPAGVYWMAYLTNDTTGSVEADINPYASPSAPYPVQYRSNDGAWSTGFNTHTMNYVLYAQNDTPVTPAPAPLILEKSWYPGSNFLTDIGQYGNNLTLQGNTVFLEASTTLPKIYNASYYSAVSAGNEAYATATGAQYVTGNNDSSVCFWAKLTSSSDPAADFIVYYAGATTATKSYAIGFEVAQMAFFGYSNNAMQAFTEHLNVWDHFCYSYTGANKTWEFWQNGASLGTQTLTSDIAVEAGGAYEINRWNGNAPGMPGYFNDLRTYDFTLTSNNVSFLYNSSAGTPLSLNGYDPVPAAPADTTPPASVTGLSSTTQTNESITWTWTNPVDADFNHVILYLDAVNLANTTGTTYTPVGLTPNSSYTLTIHTVDNLGNLNSSDVSDTNATLETTSCTSSWSCNGYEACQTTDNRSCNSVTDLNTCGPAYTGDYTEFAKQACNYCTTTSTTSTSACVGLLQNVTGLYTNTCCADTGLSSDCTLPANTTQACGAYAPDYGTSDLPAAIISGLAGFFIVLGTFAVVIVIILGVKYFQGKKPL